jgi:hypothetical protein
VRRRLSLIAIVPLGLTGGLVGTVLIAPILRLRETSPGFLEEGPPTPVPIAAWELFAYGVVTAALTMVALSLALRISKNVGLRAFGLCAVFGWLNCPACLFVSAMANADDLWAIPIAAVASTILGGILGVFFALPLGFFYGLVLAPAMSKVGALRREPGLDSVARATSWVALTVAAASLFGGIVAASQDRSLGDSLPPSVFLVSASIAIVAAVGAQHSMRRTRRWLRRVSRGEVSGWAMSPRPDAALPHLVALPPDPQLPRSSILERLPESGATYRTTETRIPWAIGNGDADEGV